MNAIAALSHSILEIRHLRPNPKCHWFATVPFGVRKGLLGFGPARGDYIVTMRIQTQRDARCFRRVNFVKREHRTARNGGRLVFEDDCVVIELGPIGRNPFDLPFQTAN